MRECNLDQPGRSFNSLKYNISSLVYHSKDLICSMKKMANLGECWGLWELLVLPNYTFSSVNISMWSKCNYNFCYCPKKIKVFSLQHPHKTEITINTKSLHTILEMKSQTPLIHIILWRLTENHLVPHNPMWFWTYHYIIRGEWQWRLTHCFQNIVLLLLCVLQM